MKINIIHKTILSLFILSAFVFIFKTVSAQDFDYTYPVQYDTPATPWDGSNGNTSSYTWTDNIDCLYSVCNPTSADATPPTAVTTPVTTQDPQQSWHESSWETRTQPTTPSPQQPWPSPTSQQTLPETDTSNPGSAPPYMGVGMTPGSGGEATPAPYSDRGDVIYCGMDYNGRAVMSDPTVGCKKCDDGRVAVGNNHDNCRGSGDTGTLVVPTPQTSAGASPQVTGAYILVSPSWSGNSSWATAPSNWSGNSSWATAPSNWGGGSNWGGNTTWNNTTVTNITKYQCVDGSMVSDSSKCPIPKCSNGALDYPNCVTFKKCSNYANDYPACVTCPTGYDYWSSKCVAKCDRYSQRDVNTGSCNLRPCTNGAVTAPYCTDCPTGMDLWNGKCVVSCPNNQYRDATGCVAYRCQNGATDYPNCGTCPAGKFLFSDGVCRACGAGTSWNGNSCIKNACNNDAINHPDCNLCANGMEYVDINKRCMYPCPSGYARSGTSCNLISTSCHNNAVNSPSCNQCAAGYNFYNNYCVQDCVNGTSRNTYGNCAISTVTCPNGTTVPVTQSCPPNMKLCDNGSMVYVYVTCPSSNYGNSGNNYSNSGTSYVNTPSAYGNTGSSYANAPRNYGNSSNSYSNNNLYTYNNTRSNGAHSVNTTQVTRINSGSATCNALATIANGAPSYGYIEWGDNRGSLIERTPLQYIGKEPTVTFSASMNSLVSDKTYSCRAVMTNNNGTYKGDILDFNTRSVAVSYTQPRTENISTVKSGKTTVKKVTVTTPAYVCKDDYGNKQTIKGEEKLLTLSIDKSVSIYVKGDRVSYTVNYKNISKVAVKNINLKISFPKEIINIKATKGDVKDNNIDYKIDELGPKGEGVIIVDTEVGTVEVGKNVTVSAVMGYDMPTKGSPRDEVSAINVGSVKNTDTTPKTSDGKTKISIGNSYLPHTLIEWAIVLLIIFAGIVGFRAWKAKREDTHH